MDEGVRARAGPRLPLERRRLALRPDDDRELLAAVDRASSGLLQEVRGVGAVRLVDDDDAVPVRERLPVALLPVVVREAVEEGLVVHLEAHVVRDATSQLRDLPEQPVREAVGHEDPIAGLKICGNSDPADATMPAESRTQITVLSPRFGSPGLRLSRPRPIATGTKTMQAKANHGIPRIAVSAPARVRASTATSNPVRRRRPQITIGSDIARRT